MARVFTMSCPALSARCDDAWIAGPSAIGSVNGMPSSITSAPDAGRPFRMASEVAASGSPAVTNVTSAARSSRLNAAKSVSIRVVIVLVIDRSRRSFEPRIFFAPGAHRSHPDVDGSEHEADQRCAQLNPILPFQERTGLQHAHLQEIGEIGGRDDDQHPADELLAVDHIRPPRCSATEARSLSPRPDMLTTIK